MVPYSQFAQQDPSLWSYFIFNDEGMGAVWKCHSEEERIYELCIKRKDPKDPLDQSIFYTFPDLDEWSTGDLFQRHPAKENHWTYYGRADNVIVFSTGEKLNPVSIEDMLASHPSLKGALVFGQNRFQAGVLLEPTDPISVEDKEKQQKLIEDVWPLIEEANEITVAHGRITRPLVAVTDPNRPFPRSGKGSIQRGMAVKLYENDVQQIYDAAEIGDGEEAVSLAISSQDALADSLVSVFKGSFGLSATTKEVNFSELGLDSLQVLRTTSILRASFKAVGIDVTKDQLPPRVVYANSTCEKLASALLAIINNEQISAADEAGKELKATENIIEKYTLNLPASIDQNKPDPANENQTILLTGTTGSLGAYLLDTLCKSPRVAKVYALNRDEDGGAARQVPTSTARGLGVDYSKVEFLQVDLSLENFGLSPEKYQDLLSSADRVIHNAWPVNLNMGVESFEPQIRGVRNLADFSIKASKKVAIVFLSTIGSVQRWSENKPVPETQFTDLTLGDMGYSRSKMASSLILDAAAKAEVPAMSIRVGQIAGPKGEKGMWNKQEFMPTLLSTSVALGLLPRELGPSEGDRLDGD